MQPTNRQRRFPVCHHIQMAFYRRISRSSAWKYVGLGLLAASSVAIAAFALASSPQSAQPEQAWPTIRPATTRPLAVFVGDSYSAGVGASEQSKRWTSVVSAEEDWEEINLANGGTGYLRTAKEAGCGKAFCPNYQDVVAAVVRNNPDIVVVAGGQNDVGMDLNDVRSAIESTFRTIRQELPNVKIIAVGPSAPVAGDDITAIDSEVRKAAAAVKATYISLLDPPVLSKSMFLTDGAHVGDEGHLAIAARVTENLK